MIDKDLLTATVNEAIEGTSLFLVDIDVRPGNTIVVEVDSTEGVDIDQCVAITRKIEERFDRDVEDYELEVGSAPHITIQSTRPIYQEYRQSGRSSYPRRTQDKRHTHFCERHRLIFRNNN